MKMLLLTALLIAGPAVQATDSAVGTDAQQASIMTVGEVRKIDKAQGKITIRHGALKNLDMPAMTMVFRVKDPTMLDQVKEGDKIKFVADRLNGAFTVVNWEPVK